MQLIASMCEKASYILLLGLLAVPACTPRQTTPVAAPVDTGPPFDAWTTVSGKSCYRPPNFATVAEGERRFVRSKAYAEASKRWRGEKEPDFSVRSYIYEQLENGLMMQPERIESMLVQDFEKCQAYQAGRLSAEAYQTFYQSLVDGMAQQDCSHAAYDLVTQYLEVNKRWQVETLVCKDEAILIRGSEGEFTVEGKEKDEDTTWITVQGDPKQPATDPNLPCHTAGCFRGQLVARFEERNGKETIFPIGKEKLFVAPAHGRISFAINDVELFDNRFRVRNQVTDYLTVEIFPAKRVE